MAVNVISRLKIKNSANEPVAEGPDVSQVCAVVANVAERDAILSNVKGSRYLVYRADLPGFEYWNGTTWAVVASGSGGISGIPLTFFASTADGDPGAGGVRLNHATPASATSMFIDDVEATDGTNIRDLLAALGNVIGAQVRLQSRSADENWIVYRVGGYTSASGYGKLTGLTVVDSSATVTLSTTASDTILSIDVGVPKDLGNQGLTNAKGISYNGEITTTGATPAVDFTTGDLQKTTLSANATPAFTAPAGVGWVQWRVVQGAGAYTITFPGSVLGGPPQPSTVNGSSTFYAFFWDGTNYHYANVEAPGTGAGQQTIWDGSAWRRGGMLTGTDLTDANQTLAIAGGAQYFLKGALTASREKRLSLTGAEADLMLTIHSWATRAFTMVVKDDASGAVLHTFPASAQPYVVTFIVNKAGTAWERSGHGPLGPVV
jgi:hypothetical protein